MTDTNPNYLDLDAVKPDEVIVNFQGKRHQLEPISLGDWIANTKAIKRLAATAGDPEKEVEILIEMVGRSLPTMKDDLPKLKLPQLKALQDFAMKHAGQVEGDKEAAAEAESRPQTAG